MTLSSGSLVSQGEETPDEYARPRPTEKYWEDYEDWKVRALNPNRVPRRFLLLPNPRPPRPTRNPPSAQNKSTTNKRREASESVQLTASFHPTTSMNPRTDAPSQRDRLLRYVQRSRRGQAAHRVPRLRRYHLRHCSQPRRGVHDGRDAHSCVTRRVTLPDRDHLRPQPREGVRLCPAAAAVLRGISRPRHRRPEDATRDGSRGAAPTGALGPGGDGRGVQGVQTGGAGHTWRERGAQQVLRQRALPQLRAQVVGRGEGRCGPASRG